MWVGYSPDSQVKSSRIGVTEEAVSVKALSAAYESSPKENIFIDRGEYGPAGRALMNAYCQTSGGQ